MTTAPKSRKTTQRKLHYLPTAGLLFFMEGKATTGYLILETTYQLNADAHVRSFQLSKADGTDYNVLLDGPGSLCDCVGFEYRGMNTKDGKGCKHVAALTKLQQLGKL